MTAPKILRVTREIMIAELKESVLESVKDDILHNEYCWIEEVLSNGLVGFNDMPDNQLLQSYWEYFADTHVANGFDDLEIEK